MNYPIWIIRNEEGAGEGWSCRFWLKACDLFVFKPALS